MPLAASLRKSVVALSQDTLVRGLIGPVLNKMIVDRKDLGIKLQISVSKIT